VLLDWSQPDHLSMREIAASGLLPLPIPEFESDQPCSAARQRQGRLRRRARGAVSVGLHPAPIMTAFAEQIPLRCHGYSIHTHNGSKQPFTFIRCSPAPTR
jgi:hypothetical protein